MKNTTRSHLQIPLQPEHRQGRLRHHEPSVPRLQTRLKPGSARAKRFVMNRLGGSKTAVPLSHSLTLSLSHPLTLSPSSVLRPSSSVLAALLLMLFAVTSVAAAPGVLAPGATLQKLAGGLAFAEGPASDARGNVFFTDQPNDRILEWSVDGKLSTFMQPSGRSNGLCFDRRGNLISCADQKNQLWQIAPDRKVTVLIKNYDGKLLNGPNDVWVRPDGGIYITDPLYKRDYWTRGPMEQPGERVYFLSPDHKTLRPVVDDMKKPNGIIGTPDGKTLYVADISGGRTYQYNIQPDGSLTNKRLFCQMGSDGMTIDNQGSLYLTGNGVTIFNKAGIQIEHIPVPEAWTGNVCFGGKDRRTLFITASKSLYAIRMRAHGVGSQ